MASKQADTAGRRPNRQPAAESSNAVPVSPFCLPAARVGVLATAVREMNDSVVDGRRIELAPDSLHLFGRG
jgi:hypothetical protein